MDSYIGLAVGSQVLLLVRGGEHFVAVRELVGRGQQPYAVQL